MRSIQGRVLFCSNNVTVRGLIEGIRYVNTVYDASVLLLYTCDLRESNLHCCLSTFRHCISVF